MSPTAAAKSWPRGDNTLQEPEPGSREVIVRGRVPARRAGVARPGRGIRTMGDIVNLSPVRSSTGAAGFRLGRGRRRSRSRRGMVHLERHAIEAVWLPILGVRIRPPLAWIMGNADLAPVRV